MHYKYKNIKIIGTYDLEKIEKFTQATNLLHHDEIQIKLKM